MYIQPTIQSHVFGKRLCQTQGVSVADELPDGEGVSVDVSAGESLVRHVEEREQLPFQHQLGDLLPLFWLETSMESNQIKSNYITMKIMLTI